MAVSKKKFIYEKGVRFMVTPQGLFYCPEDTPQGEKHPCPDCKFCQWCSDTRCTLCLKQSRGTWKSARHSR